MYLTINLCICTVFFTYLSRTVATPQPLLETCDVLRSACLNMQFGRILQTLTDGVPELGIEKLDKMKLDLVEMKKDGLIYIMKNMELEGLKEAVIDDFSIDVEFRVIKLSLNTTFKIDCDYYAAGNLFSIPVDGAGKAHLTKENVKMELLFKFDIIKTEDGKKFIDLQSYYYGVDVGGGTYRYENLFNGDKKQSDKVHGFLNRNWKTVTSSHKRFLFNKINDKIFDAFKIYLRTVPLEDISTMDDVGGDFPLGHNVLGCLSDNVLDNVN